jgi:predicted DNA-binding transcriptional regulator AlpA
MSQDRKPSDRDQRNVAAAKANTLRADPSSRPDRLMLWAEVRPRVGVSSSTARRLERAGRFPPRIRISPGRVAWRESEIDALVAGSWTPGEKSP